jgi:hypothetical protein
LGGRRDAQKEKKNSFRDRFFFKCYTDLLMVRIKGIPLSSINHKSFFLCHTLWKKDSFESLFEKKIFGAQMKSGLFSKTDKLTMSIKTNFLKIHLNKLKKKIFLLLFDPNNPVFLYSERKKNKQCLKKYLQYWFRQASLLFK